MKITRKGVPTVLEGAQPKIGDKAPLFTLNDSLGNEVSLTDYRGQRVLLSVFPDINTRVCDLQTVRFFKLAATLNNTHILNISNNTVEDLKEWCATKGVDAIMLHDDGQFAQKYGLWIPEFNVLARSVFVIDETGTIIYQEIVSEMVHEPDYDKVIAACQ